jgi:Family of unknown function (DUF6011)
MTPSRDFLTAGNAIFTVEPSDHFLVTMAQLGRESDEHYTYRIRANKERTMYFVQALTGPDNTSDYAYVGRSPPHPGSIRFTRNSAFHSTATCVQIAQRVLQRIFAGQSEEIERAGWKVYHMGLCGRCGRALTTPESCETGIGRECRKILDAERF